jgi:hypothetical protein
MKLQRWFPQVNFVGVDYSDYYIAAQRFFRCNALERATFAYIREQMHGLGRKDLSVIDVTFTDECLVARYMVLVHKDFARGIRMAEMFMERLARKGYVDPDTADWVCTEEDDEQMNVPRTPDVFNAAKPSGRYVAINVGGGGASGGSYTTFSVQRLSKAVEKETAARKRNAAALAEVANGPTPLVAKRIDGISRRWKGVKGHKGDDRETNPIEV